MLCEIPRPSLHEAVLREHIFDWSEARGIDAYVDSVGNLILRKPASPGCEAMPGVILQGHLDMVCQANAGTDHDFRKDSINPVVRDGWVVAEQTTLGADNGIGVALALAALEEPGLVHPPLEVLLTINEEAGMDGARGLEPDILHGKLLINLDTEEWGHFYLGCAGGVDLIVHHDCVLEEIPPGYEILRFDVSGLRGGHSGIDIHLGHGNAIKLLAEALHDLSAHTDIRLLELEGGTARNAIPREAFAVCAVPAAAAVRLDEWMQHHLAAWQQRFMETDPGIHFLFKTDELPIGKAIRQAERDRLLAFLDVAVNGVSRMSDDFPGVVETSSNLGMASLVHGAFKSAFLVRSLRNDEAEMLADKLASHASGYGLHQTWKEGCYPGWTPNPASALLAQCQRVYVELFGQQASQQVIHAGLECGLFAASHPDLDMISFGPDIRGAHAPGEQVEIESVAHCWQLLKALLHALAMSQHVEP